MHKAILTLLALCLAAFSISGCGSDGGTAAANVSSPVSVKNGSLPVGTNGASYKTFLGVSGGKAPYTWSIVTGKLPAGLALSSDGNITGTPTALGTFTVVFKVSDSSAPALEAQKPLQINVSSLVFTPGTSGGALYADHCAYCHSTLGSPTQQHVGATLAQIKAAIASDTGGMGEFGAGGIFPLSDADLGLIVAAMAAPAAYIVPTFTTTTLPAATVGMAYNQTLTARDGTPPYKWSTMGGDPIPAGLSLNASTGVLSGTPTTPGTANVIFMLEDANTATMVHQPITITVNAAAAQPDGAALYASKCAACHNPLASSTKKSRTATQIQNAITGNSGGMGSLSTLTPAEVQAIATALQ
jgi:large repetitive protein